MNRFGWVIFGTLGVVALVLTLRLSYLDNENRRMRVALNCAAQQIEFATTPEQQTKLSLALLFDLSPKTRLDTSRRDARGGCLDEFGLLGSPPE